MCFMAPTRKRRVFLLGESRKISPFSPVNGVGLVAVVSSGGQDGSLTRCSSEAISRWPDSSSISIPCVHLEFEVS